MRTDEPIGRPGAEAAGRTRSELQIHHLREQGRMFVGAVRLTPVRLTRMPMVVTDASLPGHPIFFANEAFV